MRIAVFPVALAAILAAAPAARAERPQIFSSPGEQVTLLELFTSEGCSSCPAAERWLGRFAGDPGLWKRFVPIAFHVDYWDRLGWKDRFADHAYSLRQREYADSWGSSLVSTPGVVANGKDWRGWRDGESIPRTEGYRPGALSIEARGGHEFTVSFEPATESPTGWTAYVVLIGTGYETRVTAGENAGATLRQDFVALSLGSAPMRKAGGGGVEARVALTGPRAGPPPKPGMLGVAAWVTASGSAVPVQAAGGFLK